MRHITIIRSFLAAIILLAASVCHAQNDIGLTLNVVPPYTTQFPQYAETPGKVTLIVRNNTNTQKSIYLRCMVTADNGITMFNEAATKPASPVVLQPFQVYTANNNNLQELFSIGKYKMNGITPTQIAVMNGLPEGNYNICIRAYDYSTDAPLSGDAPTGCKMIPLANLEPPYLVKPLAEEEVKVFEPQTMIFTWTIPAGAEPGTQYKLRIVEMLDPGKNVNNAYASATTPTFFETVVATNVFTYGLAQPKLIAGRRYAWAVTALRGPKKIAYKNNGLSEVRSFMYGKKEPEAPKITLLAPADNANFSPMDGTKKYFDFKWDYTNPQKEFYNEDVFVYEIKPGQTAADAVKNNQRINTTNEPSKITSFVPGVSTDGKKFAWRVHLFAGSKLYVSDTRTFSVEENKMTAVQFKEFNYCGYPIKVTTLKDNGGFKYSGTGTTPLYKDGPEMTFSFDNIEIKPFDAKSIAQKDKTTKMEYTDWRATNGKTKSKMATNMKISYQMPSNIKGAFWFDVSQLELNASLKTRLDEKTKVFTLEATNSTHEAKIYGTFNWQTEYLYSNTVSGGEKTALYTSQTSAKFDYINKFSYDEQFFLSLKTSDGFNSMKLSSPKNNILKLVPTVMFDKTRGLKLRFDGSYEIPTFSTGKPGMSISFTNKPSLVFTHPIKYDVALTKDYNVRALFDSVEVDLNNMPSIKVPNFKLKFTQDGQPFALDVSNAVFSWKGGLYCVQKKDIHKSIKLGGFEATFKRTNINISNSKLTDLDIDGAIDVPFINQTAHVVYSGSENGMNATGVGFDDGKATVLYQNLEGDKCELVPTFGSFKEDRIIFNGSVSFSNTGNSEKNLNIANLITPAFYIKADGEVNMVANKYANVPVPYQTPGTYNEFKYSPYALRFTREANNKYRVSMSGTVVLADNLASNGSGPNHSTVAVFDAVKYKGGGPPPSQEVKIEGGKVSAGHKDETTDFMVSFEYFSNDDVYGSGFRSVSQYKVLQPQPMDLHAKMIVAKAPGDFYYWFIEAGQENAIQIPTGVFDLGIYGFTGRVYYKMEHAGNDINKDDYQPNNDKFVGVYALTQLKTMTDNGIKFWGKVGLEVATNNGGLESVRFRGDGEIFSEGVGTTGMVQAKNCMLDFYWDTKEVYAEFPVTYNFKGAVSGAADAGCYITPSSTEIWGNATSASLFGLNTCPSVECGFYLTDKSANLRGIFTLLQIDKHFDFYVCEPDVRITSKISFSADVNYSPFLFKGGGVLTGNAHVNGCKLSGDIGLSLNAQVMFPTPTCVSAGVAITTPLKDFDFSVGIKNGGIFFGNCYK